MPTNSPAPTNPRRRSPTTDKKQPAPPWSAITTDVNGHGAHALEIFAQLCARGMEVKTAFRLVLRRGKHRGLPDHAAYDIYDAQGGIVRARVEGIRKSLGISAMEAGLNRDNLIKSLADRMKGMKHDRDFIQATAALAKICGYEAPQVSVCANVESPVAALTAAIQSRLHQIPPKPAIPAEVVSAQDVMEQNAQSKTVI